MLLTAPTDRAPLVLVLCAYYDVDPELFDNMTDLTLQRAWRIVQSHQPWP